MNQVVNAKFNEQLLELISSVPQEEESICLIDGLPLSNNYIELKCSHKFNYLSLLNELKIQRQHNNLEIQKIGSYQIKCPYCRKIHNGILPYYQHLLEDKIKGINWPPSRVLKCKTCQSIIKSGKRKGALCGKACIFNFCNRHAKLNSTPTKPTCMTILKSGKRKGEICGCKCKLESNLCGRHISKKSIK